MPIRKSSTSGIPKGNTASRPTSPTIGDVFYDGDLGFLLIWDGTKWLPCSAPAAQPTISTADVGTNRAYGSGAVTVTFTEGTSGGKAAGYTAYTASGAVYTATSTSSPVTLVVGNDGSYNIAGTAYNGFGTSPASLQSTVSVTTVPQAPTIGTATRSSTNTDVTVTWTLGSNGGKNLTSITITPYLNGTTAQTSRTAATTSSTSYTFTGASALTEGSTYTFKVKATNANGDSLESVATNSITVPRIVESEYLIIAGGGSGGNGLAGGGGAGGYRTGNAFLVAGNAYTVTVGGGGTPAGSNAQPGGKGTNSSITATGFSLAATGGGGGGHYSNVAGATGGSGGGGGGSDGAINAGGAGNQGNYSPSEGNNGGFGAINSGTHMGGGGGGAGTTGGNATLSGGKSGGVGGNGSASSITGTSVTRAGGGGGAGRRADNAPGGAGGTGGGGNGAGFDSNNAGAGSTNTGSGGGGGDWTDGGGSNSTGGSGGSGVVIIRAITAAASTTGSPTYTTSGSWHIYQFNGSGSITY